MSRILITVIAKGSLAMTMVFTIPFFISSASQPLHAANETPAGAAEKTITLDVRDMEMADVLRMIADQSGLNLIASKNVKGLISISLQDVPVNKALEAILKVNNCGYLKEDDIIQIYTNAEIAQKDQFSHMSTKVFRLQNIKALDLKAAAATLVSARGKIEVEPKTNSIIVTDTDDNISTIAEAIQQMDKKMETRIYRLSYARPADLQKSLQNIIPQTDGEFLADERTNSLMVTAAPMLLDKMDTLITSWDTQIPQVLIEAKIIQITLDKDRMLGVEWKYQPVPKHSLLLGTAGLPIPTGIPAVDALKIGVLSVDDYTATIRALENSSDVNLISSPRIVTLDNKEAKILIGSSEPYEVFHFDDQGRVTGKDLKFVEVGIKLIVTPKIANDGYITMTIHPEVSSPRRGTVTQALAIDATEADTVMTVKDGSTVVLGGLIKDDKQLTVAKIPFLGDIPLLKYLFRTTYYKTEKKEIIIFITPRVINADRSSSLPQQDIRTRRKQEMLKAMEKAM